MMNARWIGSGVLAVLVLSSGCVFPPFPPGGWVQGVEGRVIDEDTRAPIQGAIVVIQEKAQPWAKAEFNELDRLETDERGRFRWSRGFERQYDIGRLQFRITKDGYEPTPILSFWQYEEAGEGKSARKTEWSLKRAKGAPVKETGVNVP